MTTSENTVALNEIINDFKALSTREEFQLSQYRGKKLVLYFYPKDNTPGCTLESADFRKHYKTFQKLGVNIVGISRDTLRSHENFATKLELPFELISDQDEVVCRLFNVLKKKTRYGKTSLGIERSTFLIDENSRLIYEWRNIKAANHVNEVLKTIKSLNNK